MAITAVHLFGDFSHSTALLRKSITRCILPVRNSIQHGLSLVGIDVDRAGERLWLVRLERLELLLANGQLAPAEERLMGTITRAGKVAVTALLPWGRWQDRR